MRKLIPFMLCLSVLFNIHQPAHAAPLDRSERSFMKKDRDYKRLTGMTMGIGKVQTEQSEQGSSVNLNLFLLWFNFATEYQHYAARDITNTYTGLGLGPYFQVQYGHGDEGYLVRIRSEFEVIVNMTVFIAAERYREKPEYDNFGAGIGYNF